jgi:hypothetical protein
MPKQNKIEGGVIQLRTEDIVTVAPTGNQAQFGLKYLKQRKKPQLEAPKEKDNIPRPAEMLKTKEPSKSKAEEKSRTLEEITASLTPLEKAMLWAIGNGNYQASDIYEEANKKLKSLGASTCHYSEFKKEFYDLSKLPPEGKGLIEFTKRGRSFCYWLSQWGEIAFANKFGILSDRAINELGGGGKLGKAVSLELIKNWLEPKGYKVRKDDEIATDLNISERGYTDLVAEKDGQILRIEIEHRTTKDQIEKNIRKNLDYSDTLYEIASDSVAKKKLIQVAFKTMFRLRKEKPDKDLKVKIATVDELKQNGFKEWFEVGNT